MTRTLLTAIFLTLFSQTASANTVFYCTGTNLVKVEDHKLEKFKTQNFKFSVNQNTIKFGSGGYFDKHEAGITRWTDEYNWASTNNMANITFLKGYFTSAEVYSYIDKAFLITAKCDKF
jgi:hypothetical protein